MNSIHTSVLGMFFGAVFAVARLSAVSTFIRTGNRGRTIIPKVDQLPVFDARRSPIAGFSKSWHVWPSLSSACAALVALTSERVCSEAPPQLLRLTLWGYFAYSPSNPCQNRHGHTISKGFVSRSVCGWLAIVFNGCVSIWKALKSLTFQWREAPHGHSLSNPRSYRIVAGSVRSPTACLRFLEGYRNDVILLCGRSCGLFTARLERS